jgi:hypothetical protein
MMNWRGCKKNTPWPNFRKLPGVTKETTRNLSQDGRCSGRYWKRAAPEYEEETSSLEFAWSFCISSLEKAAACQHIAYVAGLAPEPVWTWKLREKSLWRREKEICHFENRTPVRKPIGR